MQCWRTTWSHAVSGAIILSPRSKSSLDWASIHGYPYTSAPYWRQGQTWASARGASSPCQHLTLAGGEDWTFTVPFSMMQHRLMPRWRSGAEGVAMARMMLHGFKLVRPTKISSSGVRVPLDVFIEIEAMVVTPA